jgi:hypothetical protein
MSYSFFGVVNHFMLAVTSHAAQQPTIAKAPKRNYFLTQHSLNGFYNRVRVSVSSRFRLDWNEIRNLLGYYADQNDDGTDRLSRNVSKQLILYAA